MAKKTVLKLEDLKANNLPELQGWVDKQEKLVQENPYVEIIDNKAYEQACKSRTALLKGRTELEKQEKAIASVLADFRKNVKSETEKLISITLPHEQKQQEEVKRWEEVKAKEKAEAEAKEQARIDGIKKRVDEFESDSYRVIQATIFSDIKLSKSKLDAFVDTDFDFEEFDILFEKAKMRVQQAWDLKCGELQEKENQRLENERLAKEAAAEKAKSELQAKRLNEILPYVAFGEQVDLTKLSELDDDKYKGILSSKKALYEANVEANNKKEQEEANKKKQEQDAIFEIRKNRLREIGVELHNKVFMHNDSQPISEEIVYNADAIEFENIISDTKQLIQDAEDRVEMESLKEIPVVFSEESAIEDDIVERLASVPKIDFDSEKNTLLQFVDSLDYRDPIPEFEDELLQQCLNTAINSALELKRNLSETINQI